MNEVVDSDLKMVAIARIIARIETARRSELWMTAIWHGLSLLLFFFLLFFIGEAVTIRWPVLNLEGPLLDVSRILLGIMAGVVLVSAHRRSAATRQIELELLHDELREIQQRISHS